MTLARLSSFGLAILILLALGLAWSAPAERVEAAGPEGAAVSPAGIESRTRSAIREITKASVRIETEDGLGSGTIVDADGYILTSAHVIEGCREVVVTLSDGRSYDAAVRGINGRGDLALLRIPARELPAARIGSPDLLERGDWVIASGHPSSAFDDFQPTISLGRLRVLEGRIRASDTKIFERALVSDVPLSAGSSGGGLWDLEGRLIAVNAAVTRSERSSFSVRITEFLRDADRFRRGDLFDRIPESKGEVADWREGRGDYSRNQWFSKTFPELRRATARRSVRIDTPSGSVRGAIISAQGEVIAVARSLAHLARGEGCRVHFEGGETATATLVGRDEAHDLALLDLPSRAAPYPFFDVARFAPAHAGTLVMTPNRRGLDGGILASTGTRRPPNELKGTAYLPEVLQCDLRLWRDQIGAPLVDARGSLLGIIVQHRLKRTEDRWERAPFGAFAMPLARIRESRSILREQGHRAAPQEGFFGVVLRDMTEGEKKLRGLGHGVLAERVERGRAAARGGLRSGDVLLGFDRAPVDSKGAAISAISGRTPGSKMRVEVDRQGRRLVLNVQVGSRHQPAEVARGG
jgi:S1-C subfamily serine protease